MAQSYLTLSELITDTQERLSLVTGSGVQTYSEDRIAAMIQHKFDVLFSDVFWPQHLKWRTSTLDGTLGVVTDSDLADELVDFNDIQSIYVSGSNTPLTQLAGTVNPLILSGTTPIHYTALTRDDDNAAKVFFIYPKTSTGNIDWSYRHHPKAGTDDRKFISTDEVPFDQHALVLGSSFDYLEDDGTNPNATQKFQAMFESRITQLKNILTNAPISLDPIVSLPNEFVFTELS